jgi:hypothetical protein
MELHGSAQYISLLGKAEQPAGGSAVEGSIPRLF